MKLEPCIIFIRDIDSTGVYGKGRNGNHTSNQIVSAIDGLDREDNGPAVIFIGTTTIPSQMDYSLLAPGRFEREILFRLPNEKERKKFIEDYLENSPKHKVNVEFWAKETKGFNEYGLKNLFLFAMYGKYLLK